MKEPHVHSAPKFKAGPHSPITPKFKGEALLTYYLCTWAVFNSVTVMQAYIENYSIPVWSLKHFFFNHLFWKCRFFSVMTKLLYKCETELNILGFLNKSQGTFNMTHPPPQLIFSKWKAGKTNQLWAGDSSKSLQLFPA